MMFEKLTVPLPQELFDICNNTFNTHIGTEGFTGKGLDHEFRKTECRYIQRAKRQGQPQPRGIQLMEEFINEQGYNLTPEILQIARYHVGNFYKWHTDGSGRGYRKLSMSCLLNDSSEFDGGEFHVRALGQKSVIPLEKSEVLVFQPDLEHQVLPVMRGQRDSLVVWFLEKPELKNTKWSKSSYEV